MSEIVPIDDKLSDTSSLLDKTIDGMVEGLTGLVSSSRKEIVISAGHLFQHCRNVDFLNALKVEWDKLREKGKIKDDYMKTMQHKDCLGELLEALDHDNPDNVRFNLLKKIFLVSATETKSNRDSVLPSQYMQIARKLDSGEVLVLETAYRIAKEGKYNPTQDSQYGNSLAKIANKSGLKYKDLVEIHEQSLIKKMLFTRRTGPEQSEAVISNHFRLTDLGWEFCKFVDAYDVELNN